MGLVCDPSHSSTAGSVPARSTQAASTRDTRMGDEMDVEEAGEGLQGAGSEAGAAEAEGGGSDHSGSVAKLPPGSYHHLVRGVCGGHLFAHDKKTRLFG